MTDDSKTADAIARRLCVACHSYRHDPRSIAKHYCFGFTSPVDGEVLPEPCEIQRGKYGLCGVAGSSFIPRHEDE